MARPSIPSISEHFKNRDAALGITLRSSHAKYLACKLAESLKDRLGNMWNVLSATSALWRHEDDTDTPENIRAPQRTLLYHLAAVLDVNECNLEFLSCTEHERTDYYTLLIEVVAREAIELGGNDAFSADELQSFFLCCISK